MKIENFDCSQTLYHCLLLVEIFLYVIMYDVGYSRLFFVCSIFDAKKFNLTMRSLLS